MSMYHAKLLASVLAIGALFAFSGAPLAHAQGAGSSNTISPVTTLAPVDGGSLSVPIPTATQNSDGTYTIGSNGTQTVNLPSSSNTVPSSGTKDSTSPQGQSDNSSTYGWIMTQIMDLFAYLLGMAVVMLDYVAYYTVVQMGQLIGGGSGGLSAIGAAWRILRDIGNIVLIFGFLAVGITTILDVNWYGGGKKMIPVLLVVAVFLNFSLFISEAVIDVGNLFATEIYAQINNGQIPTTAMLTSTNAVHNEGISNKIMAQLGLTQLYDVNTGKPAVNLSGQSEWFIGFLGIILFLVAAFVMFSLAYILIFRFVALVFLIIIAPVGFAGLAVPKLESMAKKWWGMLFEQTLTAPVLFLLLYIALAVITDAKFLTSFGASSQDSWTSFMQPTNSGGFAALLVTFAIAMGLLLAVTILSKKMGAFGADWATKLGGAASFGAASLGMRATFGSLGNVLANKRMMSWATPRKGDSRGAKYARYALRSVTMTGKGLRAGTYDVRNAKVPFVKGAPTVGGALGSIGVSAGTGAKLTAQQIHEAEYGLKPVKEYFKESEKEYQAAARQMDFKAAIAANNDIAIAAGLSKMSSKQIEELGGIKQGVEALVRNLSPQQFETIMKSDKFTDVEKGKIKAARYRKLASLVAATNVPGLAAPQLQQARDDVKKAVNALSKGELESMPGELLDDDSVIGQLSDKQRDTLTDSKERTALEKQKVRDKSPNGKVEELFRNAGRGTAGAAAVAASQEFANLTAPQVAKLPKEILLTPEIAVKLGPSDLAKLAEENKLTSQEMQLIGRGIALNPQADGYAYITGVGRSLWT